MTKESRKTEVVSKQNLTPNMVRLTLGGSSLEGFPFGYEGGYLKIVVEDAEGKEVARSYTIRKHEPEGPHITIDAVSHVDGGPASQWFNKVRVGDRVDIIGPGACKLLNQKADWFFLAGDMSALPAISVNLEALPKDAKGYAVLEVIEATDKLKLDVPKDLEIVWVENPSPINNPSRISETVQTLTWLDGKASVWVAGEFATSRKLRQYFRHEKLIDRDFMYVSCYWKIGATDEGMKTAKRNDAEPW